MLDHDWIPYNDSATLFPGRHAPELCRLCGVVRNPRHIPPCIPVVPTQPLPMKELR